jgi:hypothetical protein
MKHKRAALIVSVAAIAILAGVSWWRVWAQYEVVATVESVQPLICTNSAKDSNCGDGVIRVRTEEGAEREYRYPPGTSVETDHGQGEVFSSLEKGMKIKLTIAHGDGKIHRISTTE